MKAHITITDDQGKVFEGDATLLRISGPSKAPRPSGAGQALKRSSRPSLDFTMPLRALMKKHARNLRGHQKFALLVGALTKGKTGNSIAFKDLRKQWNKMKGPMGGNFNPVYSIRAKEKGWVDTPKTGFWAVLPHWEEALGEG